MELGVTVLPQTGGLGAGNPEQKGISESRPGGAAWGGVPEGLGRCSGHLVSEQGPQRGAGDTVLSLGCTEVMAVPQKSGRGPGLQRGTRKCGRLHAMRPLSTNCLDAGCSQDSSSQTPWDRGDWTSQGRRRILLRDSPEGGQGLGGCWPKALSEGIFRELSHHGGICLPLAYREGGRSCCWTAQAWAQQAPAPDRELPSRPA